MPWRLLPPFDAGELAARHRARDAGAGRPQSRPLAISETSLHHGRRGVGRSRPVSERERRKLVEWLRRAADRPPARDPRRRRFEVLLADRTAAVRTELLEIADLLERVAEPDPACVAAVRELLRNGCDSPLYNPDVHVSELRATLHYIRARLSPELEVANLLP